MLGSMQFVDVIALQKVCPNLLNTKAYVKWDLKMGPKNLYCIYHGALHAAAAAAFFQIYTPSQTAVWGLLIKNMTTQYKICGVGQQ